MIMMIIVYSMTFISISHQSNITHKNSINITYILIITSLFLLFSFIYLWHTISFNMNYHIDTSMMFCFFKIILFQYLSIQYSVFNVQFVFSSFIKHNNNQWNNNNNDLILSIFENILSLPNNREKTLQTL